MTDFNHFARDVASRLHHCAALLQPQYNGLIADLREIASVDLSKQREAFVARQTDILSSYGFDPPESNKPFAYADGVAIIPIHGLLINRLSWSYSFATGYNFIRSQRNSALADPDVRLIVYDVNSPGGVASGCAELAREMFDSRGEKPSLAVVDARCYSAAYFLASAADRLVVTPSGGTGSIGCVAMHVDLSDMLSADGVKVTFIFAGAEKIDGNPYQRLSNRAKASIQRDVDYHYGLFVEAVARHRDLSEEDIRSTEGATFMPPEALDIGLIDAVETPAEAVAKFFNEITSDAEAGDEQMKTNESTVAGAIAPESVVQPAAVPAMSQADIQAAITAGVAQALAADKARSSAIRTSEEAKGRETLAAHLVENTSMSAEEAVAVLAAAPKAVPAGDAPGADHRREATGFAAAMNGTANPNVGADSAHDGVAGAASDPVETGSRLLNTYAQATGRKVLTH